MNKFKNVPPKTETHFSQVRHSSVSPARQITDTQQQAQSATANQE